MSKYFFRPALAKDVAERLLGNGMFSTTTLFLGAARRTGKSNFLMQDLRPALEERGATVMYVDLWADKSRDPGELIAITIANALAAAQGMITRAAKAAGLSKVSIKGVEVTLSQVGNTQGASLADALQALQDKVANPIVLIVDEAQHTITTRSGMDAMFALKAARDILNASGKQRFCLVMSGSDRDKLLRLVHGNNTPFLGSHIDDLRLLDEDFSAHLAAQLAVDVPSLHIDNARLAATFRRFDHRPEEMLHALNVVAGPFGGGRNDRFHQLLDEEANKYEAKRASEYMTAYEGLSKLQRAVLTRVLSNGHDGRLFTADALAEYSRAHGRKVAAGSARGAIEKLRAIEPPLIWKSERGDYAVEDSGMRRWYERLVQQKAWPPVT
ncbi:ATP-binding protein [Dyella sp. M7H15-1]|uniref:ATP-binding protein n=1 Tax=Dyella sp. M7H15-1 TaxID=2501295 RepID=UPI00100511F5|nr:ATP-binding protein [Dyella sp. M7H15-1]QAU25296.1 ATP-binding protein [Dyella sp. M7H15-1]